MFFLLETLEMKKVFFVLHSNMKNIILEKATELFTRKGIRGVTMDDVAKQLSISKKTLYQYFGDKDDLVETVVKLQIAMTQQNLKIFQEQAINAVDEMILILEFINQFFSKRNPTAFHDLQKYHPNAWKHFLNHKNNFLRKSIEDNLKWGLKEGLYRKDIDIRIISRLRMEQVEAVFNDDIFPTPDFNLSEVHVHSMKFYMYGITSIKGHQLINECLLKLNKKKT